MCGMATIELTPSREVEVNGTFWHCEYSSSKGHSNHATNMSNHPSVLFVNGTLLHCTEKEEDGSTSPMMALAEALALLWLIVGIAYYFMWTDNETLKKMQPGISAFVILSLPVVLFESLYTVNLLAVDFKLIGAISLAKLLMWGVGLSVGMLSSDGDLAVGGLYALFLTLGNDIAFGVPLMSNLYPELLPYDLFMCCISELIFNPMCYFLFEYAEHLKEAKEHDGCLEAVSQANKSYRCNFLVRV